MKRVAVILSGSGVYDGSEIQEATAALFHLSRAGYEVKCFAPNKNQYHTINHNTGDVSNETRNVMVESARICRGDVAPLTKLIGEAGGFVALIIPGGFGAAKNLCNHATEAQGELSKLVIDTEVETVIKEFHTAKKPIGMCCIAPVIGAAVLKAKVTVGMSSGNLWPYGGTTKAVVAYGGKNEDTNIDGVCVDEENRVITSAAYMCNAKPHEVYDSVGLMVKTTLDMIV